MNIYLHLSIHFLSAVLAGLIVWLFFRKNLLPAILGGIAGGFLIDFDHFIDYFLAFGINFNLNWFQNGYQFLKSDKLYIFFHAWEYVIIFLILALFLKNTKVKIILFSISLGLFFHLLIDSRLNDGTTTKSYSLFCRVKNNFEIKNLVTPKHYQKDQQKRQDPQMKIILDS